MHLEHEMRVANSSACCTQGLWASPYQQPKAVPASPQYHSWPHWDNCLHGNCRRLSFSPLPFASPLTTSQACWAPCISPSPSRPNPVPWPKNPRRLRKSLNTTASHSPSRGRNVLVGTSDNLLASKHPNMYFLHGISTVRWDHCNIFQQVLLWNTGKQQDQPCYALAKAYAMPWGPTPDRKEERRKKMLLEETTERSSTVQKGKYFNPQKRPPAPAQKAEQRLIPSEKQLNLFCTLYLLSLTSSNAVTSSLKPLRICSDRHEKQALREKLLLYPYTVKQ